MLLSAVKAKVSQQQQQEMLHLCLTGFYLRKPVKMLILKQAKVLECKPITRKWMYECTFFQSNGTHQNNQPSNKDKLNVGSSSASNGRPDKSNDSSAQKQQMKISNDVGMKCSQI